MIRILHTHTHTKEKLVIQPSSRSPKSKGAAKRQFIRKEDTQEDTQEDAQEDAQVVRDEHLQGARMASCVRLPVRSTVMSTGNHMLEPYGPNWASACAQRAQRLDSTIMAGYVRQRR